MHEKTPQKSEQGNELSEQIRLKFDKNALAMNEYYAKEYKWPPFIESPEHAYVEFKKTSNGEDVEIAVRRYDQDGGRRILYQAAEINANKEIVGSMEVFFYTKTKVFDKRITIDDMFRGQSYAAPLLEAADDLFLKIRDEQGTEKIFENIENENYSKLIDVLKNMLAGKEKFDEARIQSMIDEQMRWQNVFVEKYRDHDKFKINDIAYSKIPDIYSFLRMMEKANTPVTEEAFWRATALEGMLGEAFGGNEKGIPTKIFIKPKA